MNTRKRQGQIIARLISLLFLLLSCGALVLLGLMFTKNTHINDAISSNAGITTIIWAAIRNLGIVFPVALLAFGIGTFGLAINLWRQRGQAAAWAQQVLLWVLIVFLILMFQAMTSNTLVGVNDITFAQHVNFVHVWGFFAIVSLLTYWLLHACPWAFEGREDEVSRGTRIAWQFMMPTILILGVIAIYPLEQIFISSFTNETFASSAAVEFVGVDNYTKLLGVRLDTLPCEKDETTQECLTTVNEDGEVEVVRVRPLQYLGDSYRDGRYRGVTSFEVADRYFLLSARDPVFVEALWDTIIFTIISVFWELVLGLMLAMILVRKFRGVGLMRVIILIPWAVPTIVSTLFWDIMLRGDQSGVLNNMLMSLGLIEQAQSWLTDPNWQLPMLILVDVWKTTPSMAIMLMPGLLIIPAEIYRAAEVDGAGRIRQFFSLTIPMMVPFIAVSTIFRMLNAIRVFDIFQLLVGRGRFSLATYTQERLVQHQEVGYSSAIGVIIFLIIIVFIMVYLNALKVDMD